MKKLFIVTVMLIPLFMFAEEKTIGYLGILSEPIGEAMMTALDLEHGVLVTKVYGDTPADEGGLEVGDVIYEIDGEKIIGIKILKEIIADRPNKKVNMKIMRSGKKVTKTVELGKKEKQMINLNFDIPDLDAIKEAMEIGTEEIKEQLKHLQDELDILKAEIEEIKRQLKE